MTFNGAGRKVFLDACPYNTAQSPWWFNLHTTFNYRYNLVSMAQQLFLCSILDHTANNVTRHLSKEYTSNIWASILALSNTVVGIYTFSKSPYCIPYPYTVQHSR